MSSAAQRPVSDATVPSLAALAEALGMAALVAAAAYVAQLIPRDLGSPSPLWPANAIVLTWVLRGRVRQWWICAAAAYLGNFVADMAVNDGLATSLVLAGCNTLEVLLCVFLLRRLIPEGFDPGRMHHLGLGALAVVFACLPSATMATGWLALSHHRPFGADLLTWEMADGLGLMILTPCLVILTDWRRQIHERPVTALGVATLLVVIALDIAVFSQSKYPVLFIAPLAALVATMVLELLGAAIIVLVTGALAVGFTFAGLGPIVLATANLNERLLLLQGFLAVVSVMTLQTAALHQHRRQATRVLAAARDEAEQAARVKAEFLANMSHEIRTPLTSILGFASLLAEKDLGDEAGRYAHRVLGASRNLLALVNDVLDFSKLEAGRLEIKPVAGCPEECGRDVVELFGAQAAEKGLRVSFTGHDLPAHVTADFDRVRQVLMNLVGNGVKFTAAGGVRVTGSYDAARGMLGYRVSDTGPGLDAAAQAQLFQRFSQVDASVSRAHGGSGLGLAISKGLVEAMGGRIGVDSAPGSGSAFWFEIPAPEAEVEPADGATGLDLAAFAGLRLLLVDDNAANRELIRSLLSPLGVALTTADGGEAAIALSQLHPFQLILMDLRMPGIDGWSAARAIRREPGPNQTTAMLAFSADIGAEDEATDFGVFQGLVRKPIEMIELLAAIARWSGVEAAETQRPTLRVVG